MKTIVSDITSEIIIKNSRFITVLVKIDDNTDIEKILSDIKIKYPKATHYCYGYITENYKKSSDDGEPGGTAGIPILSLLEKENIINVLAVVVRYFGGIKLGAGGLVRAYTKSVKEAINVVELVELIPGYEVSITFNYDKQKDIDYLLGNYEIINKEFLDKVIYTVLLPCTDIDVLNQYDYEIINNLLIKKKTK